ncbi:hypothetical protein ACOTWR_06825 [Aliarcobacter butzleri]|uniref:hypothetical protein n=1 Tax=Aliarcobacter butzleri TaxID=28197 RepID=UPI0021B44DB4|nr:hypothetical protein [Aliarcobacter butzleri]MCT7563325.1 hypothetical protein [Aliarcobacter butzleri]MCT7578766.1 hypothetical protein [Aliarcobacter butzleri]
MKEGPFLGQTQLDQLFNELNLNASKFNVKAIIDDIKEKGVKSEYLSCTDIDNQQYCIELDDNTFIYSQQTLFDYNWDRDNNRDVISYYTETYRFTDFSREDIEEAINAYYNSLDEVKKTYPDFWKQIVIECAFENEANNC